MPKRIVESPKIDSKPHHHREKQIDAGLEVGCFGYLFRFFVTKKTKRDDPISISLDTNNHKANN